MNRTGYSRKSLSLGLCAISAGLTVFVLVRLSNSGPGPGTGREVDDRIGKETDTTESRPPARLHPEDWFETVTERTGIDFTYRNGQEAGKFTILESLGGGVAAFDYDRDGDLDLFFTGGGEFHKQAVRGLPGALFQNLGDWNFADCSREAGVGIAGDYSHGCAAADFDADGFPDLFVCCYGRSWLFRNQGDGTFLSHSSESGLVVDGWSNTEGQFDLHITKI